MIAPRAPSRQVAEQVGRNPFGWSLLYFALRLAVVYPFVSIAVFWGWSGQAQGFGEFQIFQDEERGWVHSGFLGGLLGAISLWVVSWYHQQNGNNRLAERYGVAATSVAVVLVVILTFVVEGTSTSTGAVAAAVAVSVALEGAFTITVAYVVTVVVASVVAVSIYFVGLGLAAIAFVGSSVVATFTRRNQAPSLANCYWMVVLLSALVLANTYGETTEVSRSLLLFMGVLPILNAFFDFLSFGMTRVLIHEGVKHRGRWTWVLGILDLGLALIFFSALGCAIIAVVTLFNTTGQAPLLDLRATFLDIEANPDRYWWLYIGFFSTLLPTLAHLSLSVTTLIAWVPTGWRNWILRQLNNEEDGRLRVLGEAALTQLGVLAIIVPLIAIYGIFLVIWTIYPDVGRLYLSFFVWFNNLIGPDLPIKTIWV